MRDIARFTVVLLLLAQSIILPVLFARLDTRLDRIEAQLARIEEKPAQ